MRGCASLLTVLTAGLLLLYLLMLEQRRYIDGLAEEAAAANGSAPLLSRSSEARLRAHPFVVHIHFAESISDDWWGWMAMRITVSHEQLVLLVTAPTVRPPPDLEAHVIIVGLHALETPALARFRRTDRPWGRLDPWGRRNIERYFILLELLRRTNRTSAFFADSDVALLAPAPRELPAACDALLDLGGSGGAGSMQFGRLVWSVWAGSSIIRRPVLVDFVGFVLSM